jgi:predicted HicB family RNase H-like nuclease
MKRIINGKTYNTATATDVFSDGDDSSGAWWGLYQTRYGEFFKVVIDHGGEAELEFRPVTDSEAQELLERHANHLVEQYFGEFPEGGAAERRLTIRIPGNLADRLEAAAKSKDQSLNTYAMRCFERGVTADGQSAMPGK